MLQDGWDIIKMAAEYYFSGGYYWILLMLAVVFCLCIRGRKHRFLGWYTILYCVLVLNPVSAVILSKLGLDGVYWRVFWMIPMGGLVAYALVKIIGIVNKKVLRGILVVVSVVIVICSGRLIYTSENFQLAENVYKIPDNVLEVSECLEPGNAVLAPVDIMVWLRTYNADLYMPIGRQSYYFEGNEEKNLLIDSLSNFNVTDVEYIATGAMEYGCKYIVLENNRQMVGDWETYGYYLADQTDEFLIYERKQ